MKSASAMTLALLTLGLAWNRVESAPAADRSLDRYSHIWTTKPFVAATVVAPQAESVVQRYSITGYAQLAGSHVVFLLDRVSLVRFTVTDKQSDNGVDLVEVDDKDPSGRLKARIRAGGEMADLVFDTSSPMQMAAASPETASAQQPPLPTSGSGMGAPPPPVEPQRIGSSMHNPVPQPAPRTIKVIQRKPIPAQ